MGGSGSPPEVWLGVARKPPPWFFLLFLFFFIKKS